MKFTSHLSPETQVPTKSLKPGDVFRLAHISFKDALRTKAFYMAMNPYSDSECRCLDLSTGHSLDLSPRSLVIRHTATLNIDS